jgi:hypothetical protein
MLAPGRVPRSGVSVNQSPATVKGSLKGFTAAIDFFGQQ